MREIKAGVTDQSKLYFPLMLRDACCPIAECPKYKQQQNADIRIQISADNPVQSQIRCGACAANWPSLDHYFSKLRPNHTEYIGLFVTVFSLMALPLLSWHIYFKISAAVILLLSIGNLLQRLWWRNLRFKAYELYREIALAAMSVRDLPSVERLQRRIRLLSAKFDQDLKRDLLVFIGFFNDRGLSVLWNFQLMLTLHAQCPPFVFGSLFKRAQLQPEEYHWLHSHQQALLRFEQYIQQAKELPASLEDIFQSLYQNLADWPHVPPEEIQQVNAEIKLLLREARDKLKQMEEYQAVRQS
jgi:ElaB/YqjD/DUF883 family membrane-anchored ribosome-binding protein